MTPPLPSDRRFSITFFSFNDTHLFWGQGKDFLFYKKSFIHLTKNYLKPNFNYERFRIQIPETN